MLSNGGNQQNDSVSNALKKLEIAIGELDQATDPVIENQQREGEVDSQVQRLAEDRATLARQLDTAQARADSLKDVNEQVSRRLVDVMERLRHMSEPSSGNPQTDEPTI